MSHVLLFVVAWLVGSFVLGICIGRAMAQGGRDADGPRGD